MLLKSLIAICGQVMAAIQKAGAGAACKGDVTFPASDLERYATLRMPTSQTHNIKERYMSNLITADPTTLMRQASITAHEYFTAAIKYIDDRFGDGYAQAHPELIAAFMQTAARDFQTAITAQTMQDAAKQISETLRARSD